MALRKPLVLVSGEYQLLQSGDSLDAPQAGGDVLALTNGNAGSIVIGAPVYIASNDTVDKAKADAAGTSNAIGLVYSTSISAAASGSVMVNGVIVATTGQWDAVTGGSGGLTAGSKYYVSAATAGQLTATAPSTTGQYVVLIGIAISTTELMIDIKPRVLL